MADTDGDSGGSDPRIAEAWTDFAQHRDAAEAARITDEAPRRSAT